MRPRIDLITVTDMRIAVIGSRTFDDYEKLCQVMDELPSKVTLVVSGGAKGADSLGEKWAKENGVELKVFKPDWTKYGKGAGVVRNRQIVDECDFCLAF